MPFSSPGLVVLGDGIVDIALDLLQGTRHDEVR